MVDSFVTIFHHHCSRRRRFLLGMPWIPGIKPYKTHHPPSQAKKSQGDTFWLYYIFCFGIGFSAPQANGRPLFAVQTKELCIKAGTKLATPMEGGKLCSSVSTRLCFWDQCAMPPAEGAPMFSCFNLLNTKGASAKPLAYGS